MNRRSLFSIFPFSLFAGKSAAGAAKPKNPIPPQVAGAAGQSFPTRGSHIDIAVVHPSKRGPNINGEYLTGEARRPFIDAVIETFEPSLMWTAVRSIRFTDGDEVSFRAALDDIYSKVGMVLRFRQFPDSIGGPTDIK